MPGANLSFKEGVNLLIHEHDIGDNELTLAENAAPTQVGALTTRKGCQPAMPAYIYNVESEVVAMLPSKADPNRWYFIVYNVNAGAVELITVADLSTWSISGASGATVLATFMSAEEPLADTVCLKYFNDKIYALVGEQCPVPGYVVDESDPTNLVVSALVFEGSDNETLKPRLMIPYRLRVVYMGLGVGKESHIVFSDDNAPLTVGDGALAANGRAVVVGNQDEDRLIGATEVMLSGVGGVPESGLLLLKHGSGYLMVGELDQSTGVGTTDAKLQRFNVDCGCVSQNTIVKTPYGILWAGPDDVWLFQPGQVPIQVGTKIRPRLKANATSSKWRWHAAYFDGFYRLSILADDQDDSTILGCGEQWWLDLREGAPKGWGDAKWWGPMVYGSGHGSGAISCMYYQRTPDRATDRLLAAMGDSGSYQTLVELDVGSRDEVAPWTPVFEISTMASSGTTATIVLRDVPNRMALGDLFTVVDLAGTRSGSYGVISVSGNTITATGPSATYTTTNIAGYVIPRENSSLLIQIDQGRSQIIMDLRSKLFDFGDPKRRKIFDRADIQAFIENVGKLTMDIHLQGGAGSQSVSKSFLVNGDSSQNVADVLQAGRRALGSSVFGREYQHLVFQNSSRAIDRFMRARLYNNPGFLIDSTNSKLYIGVIPQAQSWDDTDIYGVTFELTLTEGWYSNVKTLADEVIRAINATDVLGTYYGPFAHNYPSSVGALSLPVYINAGTGYSWFPLAGLVTYSAPATDFSADVWEWLGFEVRNYYGEYGVGNKRAATRPFAWSPAPAIELANVGMNVHVIKGLAR